MPQNQANRSSVRFLRNAWYLAGYSEELDEHSFIARKILSQPLLIFRNEDGQTSAILDRCPHRLVPLHLGHVCEGRVTCGYHGIAFDGQGRCVHNPHGSTAGLSVPHFEMEEAQGLLWVWMGEPERADRGLLPAFDAIDEAAFFVKRGYLHGRANYELMTDNILDLSHIEFLHPALGTEAVSKAHVDVRQQEEQIVTTRRMRDELLPEGLAYVYRSDKQRVNRTMEVTWRAPATMILNVTVEPADEAQNWRTSTQSLHIFTPETETSTHYFYVGSMPHETSDAETFYRFAAALGAAFANEDKPMIDAQAELLGDREIMECQPKLLGIDKAGVLARRKLAAMIEAEGEPNGSENADKNNREGV